MVLLAGTFEAFDENRARAAGADAHIVKPFESQALLDKVKTLVGVPIRSEGVVGLAALDGHRRGASSGTVSPRVRRPRRWELRCRPARGPECRVPCPAECARECRECLRGLSRECRGRCSPECRREPARRCRAWLRAWGGRECRLREWACRPECSGRACRWAPNPECSGRECRWAAARNAAAGSADGQQPGMQRPGMPRGSSPACNVQGAPRAAARHAAARSADGQQPGMPRPGMPPGGAPGFPRPPGGSPLPGSPGAAPARARDPFGLGAPAQQLPPRPRQPEASVSIDVTEPEHAPRPPPAADGGEAVLREALSRASREVIEKIAWEVVPELAEVILRDEAAKVRRRHDCVPRPHAHETEFPKAYDPAQVEPRWYRVWIEQATSTPTRAAPKAPFCIVIPPPNVTGSLHMGHALTDTIQDILIRWRRMAGLQRAVAAGHRPRRHRHPDGGRARARSRPRGKTPPRPRPRGVRQARLGSGRSSYGGRIAEQLKVHGLLARLGARALHDGRGALARGARGLRAPVRGGPDLPRPSASSTGARAAAPRSPTSRSSTRSAQGELWHIRLPGGGRRAARSWSPPRAPRRCWATPRWPCTPTTSATSDLVGKTVRAAAHRTARSRSSPTPMLVDHGVRHRRGQGDARRTTPTTSRPGSATSLPMIIDLRPATARMNENAPAPYARPRPRSRRASRCVRGPRGRAGCSGEDRAAHARRRPLPALRHRGRADALDAVVREDGAAGRAGDRGGASRARTRFVPETLDQDLLRTG